MMEIEEKTVNADGTVEAFIVKADAGDLCRLCANTDNQLIPIYRGEGLEHHISVKIEKHLPIIKVTEVDKLPLQICYQCASTLISWHNLYEGCLVADKRLREILAIDEKLCPEDESFGDYVDDYRDNYDDDTHETLPTSTNSSNVEANTSKDNSTVIPILSDTKVLNETDLEASDERYSAQGTRKRDPLTANKRPAPVAGNDCGGSEERAKMVKSKKIRLLMMESPSTLSSSVESGSPTAKKGARRLAKSKCNVCGVTFTHLDDLKWHKETIHGGSDVIEGVGVRKSSRIRARSQNKNKESEEIEMVEIVGDLIHTQDEFGSGEENDPLENENEKIAKGRRSEAILICHHCSFKCKRKNTLIKHIVISHPDVEINLDSDTNRFALSCALCMKTFTHKANLRKHVLSHGLPRDNGVQKVSKSDPKWKRGYCCDICNRGFHNQRDMLAHRDVVHDSAAPLEWTDFCRSQGKLKYCHECDKYFNDNNTFSSHECVKNDDPEVTRRIQQLLESPPTYKCNVCWICFHWKWMYRAHRENVHHVITPIDRETPCTEIPFYCKCCLKAFEDGDSLAKHVSSCVVNPENKIKEFRCSLCDKSFTRKADFQRHIKIKHPDPELTDNEDPAQRKKADIPCPYCDVHMPTRNGILKHIKEIHSVEMDTPFACITCNKVFKRKATMDTHNLVYHPKEENPEETNKIVKEAEFLLDGEIAYHCNVCNRNLPNSIKFIAHYRLHNLERKYTCDLCGKQTRTQHQLNTHIKIIHLDIRNFECDICGKSFHSRQSCEEHRRIHTGERPFSCEICGKTFIALNALFTHKKFHNDFFAHPCSMCPKKFKVRRSLINHIRTHTGERPYKCDICSKTFNNSSRFSYHKKVTHSDNRPFTCDQCGSCFKANKFLMRHMKLHSIRTHVQLRRRNNPTYFENHDSNPKRPPKQKKTNQGTKEEANAGAKSNDGVKASATFTTIRKITCSGIKMESGVNSASDVKVLAIDTRSHFLADAFTDDGMNQNELDAESTTNSAPSETTNMMCL